MDDLGKSEFRRGEGVGGVLVGDGVLVRLPPGEDAGAGGRAVRSSRIKAIEAQAFRGHGVEIWGF